MVDRLNRFGQAQAINSTPSDTSAPVKHTPVKIIAPTQWDAGAVATTHADRARLVARYLRFSPRLDQLDARYGLAWRIDQVRQGLPGMRPSEREMLREILQQESRNDRNLLKELREGLVEKPPHPALKKMRGHPALSGPPTVEGLLSILSGEALQLPQRPVAPHLSGEVFAPLQPAIIRRSSGAFDSGWLVCGYSAGQGSVILRKDNVVRGVKPDELLALNPALVPLGTSLRFPYGEGLIEEGWRVAGHSRDGKLLLRAPDGSEQFATIAQILPYNRAALIGDVLPSPPGGATHVRAGATVDPADVAPMIADLDRRLAAAYQTIAGYYGAARGKGEAVEKQVHDWSAAGGQLMHRIQHLRESLVHSQQGTLPISKVYAGAELHEIAKRDRIWRQNAPFSWQQLQALPLQPTPPPIAPYASLSDAQADLEAQLKPFVEHLNAQRRAQGTFGELFPIFRVDPDLMTATRGRPADFAAAHAIAHEAAFDQRLALDHLPDGCYARADLICERLEQKGIAAGKIFVTAKGMTMDGEVLAPTHARSGKQGVYWGYHVAAVAFIKGADGKTAAHVIDPAFSETPMRLDIWVSRFTNAANVFPNYYLTSTNVFNPDGTAQPQSHDGMLAQSWARLAALIEVERGRQPGPV